jgi:drug/metabolite transporter (DMT)-like permease
MNSNARGSLMMVLAMAGFALEDMFIKAAAATLPAGEIMLLFGLGGMLIFCVLTLRRGETLLPRAAFSRAMGVRAICEITGRLGYTLAIALAPLATASAILQATPLVVAMGAALFFGEQVGWRRWTAIFVGFAGVLLVLRPGVDGFTPTTLFALVGMLGFAGRDLATRAAPPALSHMQLGIYGFFMLIPAGMIALAFSGGLVLPTLPVSAQLVAATVIGVYAYYALTVAMRSGEVSVVAPFRYTRLVFALVLAVAVFGERPDMLTLVGSSIIVLSGLYSLVRDKRARSRAKALL